MAQPTEIDDPQTNHQQLVLSPTLISEAESFEKKGNSWFAISQSPSDLTVIVDDVTFYLHKYALLSRCGYLKQIELQTSISNQYELKLPNIPGGAETFETVVKFCYNLPVSLTTRNTAALRCAAEILDMSEELEEGNLISKTESFLTFVVFSSWKDSITVLKSCETLSKWAENLQIVRRCCDSIAWACQDTPGGGWVNDVATLRIDHFKRIMTSMAVKGLRPDFVGSCVMMYAEKWLLGNDDQGLKQRKDLKWSIQQQQQQQQGGRKNNNNNIQGEQRAIIESLVGLLPQQKDATNCKFLLWLLKMGVVHSISPALISELEKRVGMVLEDATAYDLLIPNGTEQGTQVTKSMDDETMYNVDSVQRILEYYLMNEEQQQAAEINGKVTVSKLLDSYLAEIAGDPKLSATKFQAISESLPHAARPCDDGLYRAIDTYLKAHPALSEHDRRKLCRLLDCQKLSVDACSHAAQNDRLPLRTIIQVLFAEQVKLRAIIRKQEVTNNDNSEVQEDNSLSSKEEIKMLKIELEKMMTLIEELQRDHINLQQECKKMKTNQKAISGWFLGWKKLKKTTLFQGKMIEKANTEGNEKEKRRSSILRFKRGQSMS